MTISLDLKSVDGDIVTCSIPFTDVVELEEGPVTAALTDNDTE